MSPFILNEVAIDQGHNPQAERLILFKVLRVENLEPHFEIRVANENGRILLVVFSALQEPPLVGIGIFDILTRIQAFDNISCQTIVDFCTIVFAKDESGLTVRIPDDVLPVSSGAADKKRPL